MFIERHKLKIQVIGFLLVGINLLSLILWTMGLELTWLRWLGSAESMFVIVTKLVLALIGFVMIFIGSTDLKGEY